MEGKITVSGNGGCWEVALPHESVGLTGLAGGTPQLVAGQPDTEGSVFFEWLPRSRTWDCRVITVTGTSRNRHLRDVDQVEVGAWRIQFRKTWSPPEWNGAPFTAAKLTPATIYEFGRGPADPAAATDARVSRICLDPDDGSVSKIHARIRQVDGTWKIEDLSKTGTELNGGAFVEANLIFGDRFRIRDFVFEFRGDEIRRVDGSGEGAIEARDLMVRVADRTTGKPLTILEGVSLDIRAGEFIGILGGSGQGKSTLLNALCGIRPADNGKVLIGGIDNTVLANSRPGAIGFVPQDDIVHRELIVRDAFRMSARLRLRLPRSQREDLVERTMELLGLTEHAEKRVMHLSGGQRKRVSIGIELLTKPAVLFLDEPSSGLDPATEESLMELLQALTLTNLTVICTTHVLQKAYLFDRLLFVHGGRLIFDGSAREAREHFLGSGRSTHATNSATSAGPMQSPLEKIYSAVLRGGTDAAVWEQKFIEYRQQAGGPHAANAVTPPREPSKPARVARVGALTRFATLMRRQWKILMADWLNLAFLFSQVIFIGMLISWVSDEFGFRMFLGLIAAMWFGCSNGAQQIVAELPILRREQVCGLGRNVYLTSKFAFQGLLSCLQGLLLFGLILVCGHLFHPADFDRQVFLNLLEERQQAAPGGESAAPGATESPAGGDDFDLVEEGKEPPPASAAEPAPADQEAEPATQKKVPFAGLIATVAHMFVMQDCILDSGPKELLDTEGNPLKTADGTVLRRAGVPLWRVLLTGVGLKLLAFAAAAMAGVGMGLAVSAWVRTTTQAVMWVPLLLIPQILFGGYVITLPKMPESVRRVAVVFPSHACQRIIDVSNLFGRAMPFMTNQTKEPMFLTGGAKREVIEWTDAAGNALTQDFDRESEVNTSWQNLVVAEGRMGQHKVKEEELGQDQSGQRFTSKTDTVETRNDVRYRKGTIFLFTFPATVAATVLGAWVVGTFATGLGGVFRKT